MPLSKRDLRIKYWTEERTLSFSQARDLVDHNPSPIAVEAFYIFQFRARALWDSLVLELRRVWRRK